MTLDKLRNQIDLVDDQISDLFLQRMELARQVAAYKQENHLPVMNAGREQIILERISERVGNPLEGYARILFRTLFDLSRTYQDSHISAPSSLNEQIARALAETPSLFPEKAVVACQGIRGAYSQLAAEKLFDFPSIMYFNHFEGVFNAVEKGLCRYGVLPIENSSYGSVGEVYDLMKNYHFHIARSIKLHIRHALLAKPETSLSDIREIFSHDQAIGQCAAFLKDLPGVKVSVCENTAVAAELVAADGRKDTAAISSLNCASLYGLQAVRDDIQNSDNNYTRFICIAKDLEIYPGSNKISLMLSLPHQPLSLYRVMARFASLGLNLTKLESRPIPGSDFEFMFYFDVDGSLCKEDVRQLLCHLEKQLDLVVFLGNYMEE